MRTAYAPLMLAELAPRPIVGLTLGRVAATEASRELTAMMYRYLRAVERMRIARVTRHGDQ